MKTAEFYIKKKYDCYKNYSEESIRDVCHIWCELIEEAQNDVKKEYEEKLRWIPVEEKLPDKQGHYLVIAPKSFPKNCKVVVAEFYEDNNIFYSESSDCPIEDATHWRSFL